MSENLSKFNRALDGFSAVVSTVPESSWNNQSPCTEWKARHVVGHVIGGQMLVKALAETGAAPSDRSDADTLAGSDPAANFQAARAAAAAATTSEALAKTVASPMGPMPLDNWLGIMTLDVLTHTWDLATAVGQKVTLDADLVHEGFENIKPMDAMLRMPGVFGPKQEAPAGAAEQEQLMAFLGRSV